MRYIEFKNHVQGLPVIASKDIVVLKKDKQAVRNQLKRWQDKKLIIKLKRGIYILNENDRRINPNKQFIANQLYAPSYVSLEYALNFYGLIPERVFVITSVTTKKTGNFVNELGTFTYQHIKPSVFTGFKTIKDGYGLTSFIAEPEKAVVDFLYLGLHRIKAPDIGIFEASYRFQNVESLSLKRITELASLFGNAKLAQIARLFCEFIKKEKHA